MTSIDTRTGIGNLLSDEDSGFEGGTVGHWGPYQACTVANSTTQAHYGTHSMAVTCDGTNHPAPFIGWPTLIPVTPGQAYLFDIWFWTPAHYTATNNIWWVNAAGGLVGAISPTVDSPANTWNELILTAVAPTGCVAVQLAPGLTTTPPVGTVFYIDDISIAPAVVPAGPSGYIKFILSGGPLDGEQQIVQGINTAIGAPINFNIPNYQIFAPDGATLIALGLQVQYAVLSQGPPPGVNDTWTTSWNLGFVAESYTAPPPPVTPPVIPPNLSPAVWMAANTGMIVNASDPWPGVNMLDTQATLEVDGTTQTVGWSSVSMEADTTMIAQNVDWSTYVVALEGDTNLVVAGMNFPGIALFYPVTSLTATWTPNPNLLVGDDANFDGGTIGHWLNNYGASSLVNSTAQAHSGSRSLAVTSNGATGLSVYCNTSVAVTPNSHYTFSCWIFPATHARQCLFQFGWYNSSMGNISIVQPAAVVCPAGVWTQLTGVTGTPPGGAAFLLVAPVVNEVPANGEVFYIDDCFVALQG